MKRTKQKIKWFLDSLLPFGNLDKYCTIKGCFRFAGKHGEHMLIATENTKRKFPLCEECYKAHCLYMESKLNREFHGNK